MAQCPSVWWEPPGATVLAALHQEAMNAFTHLGQIDLLTTLYVSGKCARNAEGGGGPGGGRGKSQLPGSSRGCAAPHPTGRLQTACGLEFWACQSCHFENYHAASHGCSPLRVDCGRCTAPRAPGRPGLAVGSTTLAGCPVVGCCRSVTSVGLTQHVAAKHPGCLCLECGMVRVPARTRSGVRTTW
jgi:hypothetical protein